MNLSKQVKPVAALLGSLALSISFAVFAPSALAAGLCSTSSQTGGISVSNMTYEGANANDCYGVISGNLTPDGLTALANDTTQDPGLTWGGGWSFLTKDEGSGGTGDFLGLGFTLSASTFDSNTGTWTLTATDTNGTDPLNLPTSLDFIAALKGGGSGPDDTGSEALWFFDDVNVLAGDNDGTFQIVFLNNGENPPDLSHLDLLVREGDDGGEPPTRIPEPASLALLGLGLVSLAAIRRRRSV